MSAITALTAQNTIGVQAIQGVPPEFVKAQIDSVLSDIGVDVVKTGMLNSIDVIQIVSKAITHYNISNIVVDPVMFAKSGDLLIEDSAMESLLLDLIPLARVLTPNLLEAEKLLNKTLKTTKNIETAARELSELGPSAVIIKGGYSNDAMSNDCVFIKESSQKEKVFWLKQKRIETNNIQGSGCTFSSAVAAFLAHSLLLEEAIITAKNYITQAILSSQPWKMGSGKGPVDHFFNILE